MAELPVYYETRRVGTIETHADGPTFVYDQAWLRTRGAFPLSILMPLSSRRTQPKVFAPWAANLLPEAAQLRAIGRNLGAAPEDTIGILAEIGRDTAGALSIGHAGTSDPGGWKKIPDETALERIIKELPRKPFLVGEEGVRMSLAGVQSKIGVAINAAGEMCIPHDGAPSTHILKPDSDELFGGVQNEALCLVLARRCGINAAQVTTGKAGQRSYVLVTRYDRVQQGGRWRRLHQEDFCQGLGKPPAAKYESNDAGIKGPTLADMFTLTRNVMQIQDLLHLLDFVVFNILVCNTDAHAKNYSLMISGRGFSLAPMYDVMCAAAWDNVTRNLAQTIAGKKRGEHLKRRHWERFARECSLNPPRLLKRVEDLAVSVLREIHAAAEAVAAMPAGTHPLLPKFVEAIETRARAVIFGLNDISGADEENETSSPQPSPPQPPKKKAAPRKAPLSKRIQRER